MRDFTISGYSREEYESKFMKSYHKSDAIDDLLNKEKLDERHIKTPIVIIVRTVFGVLSYHQTHHLKQYTMSKLLQEVVNYGEEEYENEKRFFDPQECFATINSFSDRVIDCIKYKMGVYGTSFPTLSADEENCYLDFLSTATKECVLEITNLFERDVAYEVKEQYHRLASEEDHEPVKQSWVKKVVTDKDTEIFASLPSERVTQNSFSRKKIRWAEKIEGEEQERISGDASLKSSSSKIFATPLSSL